MSTKDFLNIGLETTKGSALHSLRDEGSAGAYDFANLVFTGILVDQETFELGDDVYEVNLVATDTASEADAQVEVGDTSITFDTAFAIPALPGDVIRMEAEFMIVIDYNVNGPSANVVRGAFGSTEAVHSVANSDTFQALQPVVDGNLAIPVAVVDESVSDALIALAVQFWSDGGYSKGLGGGIGVRVQNGLKVDAINAVNDQVVFAYPSDGGVAPTLATDMTNATITAFGGGVEEASQRYCQIHHKVTAGDVSADQVVFFAPFVVDEAYAIVMDSTGVQLIWDGTVSVAGGRLVTVLNGGAIDPAAGDTIILYISAA